MRLLFAGNSTSRLYMSWKRGVSGVKSLGWISTHLLLGGVDVLRHSDHIRVLVELRVNLFTVDLNHFSRGVNPRRGQHKRGAHLTRWYCHLEERTHNPVNVYLPLQPGSPGRVTIAVDKEDTKPDSTCVCQLQSVNPAVAHSADPTEANTCSELSTINFPEPMDHLITCQDHQAKVLQIQYTRIYQHLHK